jgi:hydrogenase nickel incorporation protein HypA/HybF
LHEAGIAATILEIAEAARLEHGAASITRVAVRVGEFSGVVPVALTFAFEALKQGTAASGAELAIESIPVRAWCATCDDAADPADSVVFWCERCGGVLEILAGRELDVMSVDLEESRPLCSASQ